MSLACWHALTTSLYERMSPSPCGVNQIDVPHIEDAWLQLEEGSPGAHAYSASVQLSFEYEYEKEFI